MPITAANAPSNKPAEQVSRRGFLKVSGLGTVGLTTSGWTSGHGGTEGTRRAIIQILLVGGPSHLDTWDLKPNAPQDVRGPFRPIATNVSGIQISECFPRMARMADRYAILRSVHHDASPIHETGHQLMQTGALCRGGLVYPHCGAVLAARRGPRNGLPAWVALPAPIGNTGVSVPHGQDAGYLGRAFDPCWIGTPSPPAEDEEPRWASISNETAHAMTDLPFVPPASLSAAARAVVNNSRETAASHRRYGSTPFGQSCLWARQLVEAGVRLVTVNMFDTVFHRLSWDMHANGSSLAVTLDDYQQRLCPMFDEAYTALLSDLDERGLLDDVLVVAAGEFGRTPKLNAAGGRDHWPGVWSILMAGGGIKGGQIIGSSDKNGSAPRDRPILPAEVVATMYHSIGLKAADALHGPGSEHHPMAQANPIHELF